MKSAPESLPLLCPPGYPEIILQNEFDNRTTATCENVEMAFLSQSCNPWKFALYAWQNKGFLHMLEELSKPQQNVPMMFTSVCKHSLMFFRKFASLFSRSSLTSQHFLNKRHTSKCPVQVLVWHPHMMKVAVALRDSSVRVYSSNSSISPLLKHRMQSSVADLAWQPLSSSVLAVACESCVLIWHVEPTSLAARPSSSCVQILQLDGHTSVTSLAWTPTGSRLVSASFMHSSIVVWDVPKEQGISLRWDMGGGVPLLACSPDGVKLFAGSLSPFFRICDMHRWKWENWSNLSGRCKAACWSPDSSVLIFAMEKDTALYAIKFASDNKNTVNSAAATSVMLADLSEVNVSSESGLKVCTGGEVHSIVWDGTGERLAVLFEDNTPGSNFFVAVFKVSVYPILELLPGGLIKGRSDETAHHIAFAPNFQGGALLSVVWSSGRVGYVPLYFVPAQRILHTHA
ncbi:aladin [Plakobranchus ocellatus]|uniref:Aladin n=1 Tax=Plakobranchus ocellatus TaxID=259542 RepID=A0AAV4B6Y5_9GAST|nr:aladin [Plakobranchus ocellatus]